MQGRTQSIAPGIVELIEQTVRELMTPFGLREVVSEVGEDHDGDAVIQIEARYDLNDTPVDPVVMAELALLLRERVWNAGETRFPHIRHKFDERHPVKELPTRSRRRTA